MKNKQENEKNYRGTGFSKVECQRQVAEVIAQFKRDNPGKPVPSALERWVDNIATREDVREAKRRMQSRLP